MDCPHPHKLKFFSRKHAKEWRKHGSKKYTGGLSRDVRPYLCECGFYHLGNLHPDAIKNGRSEVYGAQR